jgi:hypothetical protein
VLDITVRKQTHIRHDTSNNQLEVKSNRIETDKGKNIETTVQRPITAVVVKSIYISTL